MSSSPAQTPSTRTASDASGAVPAQRRRAAAQDDPHRAFTTWMEEVSARDPGARSALRSGVGKGLDSVPRMHRLVAAWLPASRTEDTERAYYAVAAMIAEQARRAGAEDRSEAPDRPDGSATPQVGTGPEAGEAFTGDQAASATEEPPAPGPVGASAARPRSTSLGVAFAQAVTEAPGRERLMRHGTAEARLNLLTRQSVTGLHRHLPAAVRYLRSLDVPVDWAQLLRDLASWRRHHGRISRRWLQDFYRLCQAEENARAREADAKELAEGDAVRGTDGS